MKVATAQRWNEGGKDVRFESDGDQLAVAVRTLGKHPALFVFDPIVLWRLLRSKRWDLVDIHEEPYSLAAAEVILLRRLAGLRTPYTLYSAQNLEKRYPVPFRWLESLALRGAGGIHVCNAEAGQILVRKGFTGTLRVLPLGVDMESFSPADRKEPIDGLKLGYVGRLEPYKGVSVLLEALAADGDMTLDIVGDGPERQSLVNHVARLGISDRVRFLGYLGQTELPEHYRRLDAIVVPSVPWPGWLEQFCRVAVEAMASGVPVVASDSGALPEVVESGGLLFAPGNVAELSRSLRRLRDEPGLWSRLRLNALAKAEQYSWQKIAGSQSIFYSEVIEADEGQKAPSG